MKKLKILVVEDEADLLEIMQEKLESFGDCITATDGIEAYRKARNQEFDLICSDFKMPKLNGAKLIAALRQNESNPKTPIIVVSAFVDEAKNECTQYGVTENVEFVSKPVSTGNLSAVVEKALNKKTTPKSIQNNLDKPSPIKLDVEFINPFLDATVNTIKNMGQLDHVKHTSTFVLKREDEIHSDITGTLIILAPSFSGKIAVSFPTKTFLKIVSNMLGEEYKEIIPEIEDAALELTNIIYGAAKCELNKKNYQMEKALPSIVRGTNHFVRAEGNLPTLVTKFESDAGEFFVTISLNTKS